MEVQQSQPPLPSGRYVALPDGRTTWVWEAEGPPGAPTLLLIHGWMATGALNWYPALERLPSDFHVVSFDQRGHGRGPKGKPFTLEGCADDAAALIETLDLQNVIAVGYSMGGPVAQLLARRRPDLLSGLVLCATAATFAQILWLRPLVRLTCTIGSAIAEALPAPAKALIVRRIVHDRRGPTPHGEWAGAQRAPSNPAALLQAGGELNAYDSTVWLPYLDLPTAVIVTAEDTVVDPERQRAMARLIPDAWVTEIPANHAACLDAADHFVPALARAAHRLTGTAEVSERDRSATEQLA
jgi:3-oxoadipate enol-lactonase